MRTWENKSHVTLVTVIAVSAISHTCVPTDVIAWPCMAGGPDVVLLIWIQVWLEMQKTQRSLRSCAESATLTSVVPTGKCGDGVWREEAHRSGSESDSNMTNH